MAYRPPTFNLVADIWTCDGARMPADGVADVPNIPAQKYLASRTAWPVSPPHSAEFWRAYHPPVQIRLQHSAPASGPWPGWKVSCIECPSGSGQYYRPVFNDIQHEGFPNEYALIVCVQCNASGKTIPPAGMGALAGDGPDACGVSEGGGGGGGGGGAFLDTFTDAAGTPLTSHTPDSGGAWSNQGTHLDINSTGDMVVCTFDSEQQYAIAGFGGAVAGTQKARFFTPGSIPNGVYCGTLFRAAATNNWLGALLADDGTGVDFLEIYRNNAGTITGYGVPTSTFSLSTGTAYDIEVIDDGTNITVNLIQVGMGTVVSTSLTTTDNNTQTDLGISIYSDTNHPSVSFDQLTKTP